LKIFPDCIIADQIFNK